jgi:hypothetical protein
MAKFIQVTRWDQTYERAEKIVVNTEQIVQIAPVGTGRRQAIISTVREIIAVNHTVEELASMLSAEELK